MARAVAGARVMQSGCPIIPGEPGFAPGILAFIDCQARTLGASGYQTLAAPGSTAATILTVSLTLFVAFIGFRMLMGETPTVREGVLSLVKIGIVLALATSWPAFQVLVYSVTFDAPAQLAQEIGSPVRLPGVSGDLALRLDAVDQTLDQLAIAGVGQPPVVQGQLAGQPVAPPPFANFNAFALGSARAIFLVSSIAAFGVVRLLAGILLALGPLFIAFLLFDGTRGLTVGWVRGLVGAALGAFVTTIILSLELSLFEPWLAELGARRDAGLDIIGVPGQLLAGSSVFAVFLTATIYGIGRVAAGFNFPPATIFRSVRSNESYTSASASINSASFQTVIESRSRAAAIADSVATMQRREGTPSEQLVALSSVSPQRGAGSPTTVSQSQPSVLAETRRRATRRVSASAVRRDRT